MGHKSGQCKEPGCNKDQWKDGYCRNCAQYAIQKTTIDRLTSTTQLLLKVAEGLKRVEENVANLQPRVIEVKEKIIIKENIVIDNPPKIIQNKIKNIPIDEDNFIPTINTDQIIPNIRDTKTLTVNKDINKLVNKLGKT